MIQIFLIGLRQIKRDGILFALLPAPFIVGIIFKTAAPFINEITAEIFGFPLTPYYGLIDGLLLCLTPLFAAMISAFLILEERESGITAFYNVSPAGGAPYLAARLGFPMLWAFIASVAALLLFNVSEPEPGAILKGSFISVLTGLSAAMMVVSFANNRVEGLAFSKLMGICLLGLFAVWLVPAPYCYISAFLPSFWVGQVMQNGGAAAFTAGTATGCAWILLFARQFLRL